MGTTLNKLEYVNTTKGQIKTALNQFGAGITDETTFRNYVDKINDIYDNWEKVTDEGTDITLTPTKKGKLQLTPKGNIKQDSTQGYNILPLPAGSQTIDGVTFTPVYKGKLLQYILVNGTATKTTSFDFGFKVYESGTYLLSGCPANGSDTTYCSALTLQGGSWAQQREYGSGREVTTDGTSTYSYRIRIYSGYTCNNLKYYPMVITGTTAKPYEPYTNGVSPNPDYEQPIEVVTGDNTITVSNGDNTETQTQLISLGDIELCKIGNYEDIIFHAVNGDLYYDTLSSEQKSALTYGTWYKLEAIGVNDFDENSSWEDLSSYWGQGSFAVRLAIIGQDKIAWSKMYCKYFIAYTNSQTKNLNNEMVVGSSSIVFNNSNISTLTEWRTWVTTHHFSVYYPKSTPTYTPIADTTLISQLNNLEKLQSYLDTTNITSSYETGNAQMILSASALKKGGN